MQIDLQSPTPDFSPAPPCQTAATPRASVGALFAAPMRPRRSPWLRMTANTASPVAQVPDSIKDTAVWSLDLAAVVAGAKFRGDFEERLRCRPAAASSARSLPADASTRPSVGHFTASPLTTPPSASRRQNPRSIDSLPPPSTFKSRFRSRRIPSAPHPARTHSHAASLLACLRPCLRCGGGGGGGGAAACWRTCRRRTERSSSSSTRPPPPPPSNPQTLPPAPVL